MVMIGIIEGALKSAGGYCIHGRSHIGDEHEALVDEARQIAYATGRNITEVLIHLIPRHSANASEEITS